MILNLNYRGTLAEIHDVFDDLFSNRYSTQSIGTYVQKSSIQLDIPPRFIQDHPIKHKKLAFF